MESRPNPGGNPTETRFHKKKVGLEYKLIHLILPAYTFCLYTFARKVSAGFALGFRQVSAKFPPGFRRISAMFPPGFRQVVPTLLGKRVCYLLLPGLAKSSENKTSVQSGGGWLRCLSLVNRRSCKHDTASAISCWRQSICPAPLSVALTNTCACQREGGER